MFKNYIKQVILETLDLVQQNSTNPPIKIRHMADLKTEEIFHLDENYNVWSCDCKLPVDYRASLCLSTCNHLKEEGNLREIRRKIAEKRKELGLLESITVEDLEHIDKK